MNNDLMNNDLELYQVIDTNKLKSLGTFYSKEDVEEFIGQDLIEELLLDATYIVLFKGGFVGCFTK